MFVRCKRCFEDGKEHRYGSVAENVRGRCYNVVDPVNHHEAELRSTRQGGTADQLARRDFVILDELGTLPFATVLPLGRRAAAVPSDEPALRAHLDRHHHQPRLRRVAPRLRRPPSRSPAASSVWPPSWMHGRAASSAAHSSDGSMRG